MPDPAPIRGRWTVRTCPTCGAAAVDPEDYVCTCTCALESIEVVPVPDEAAIERLARHIAEKRWAAWLHPYKWDEVTEGQRNAYREEALEYLRAALEPPEVP